MTRLSHTLSFCSALLSFTFVVGCAVAPAEEAYAIDAPSLEIATCPDDEPTVEVTPNNDGSFDIFSSVVVDKPINVVWLTIRNFERLVSIGLPGIATNFQWINGGGPNKIPSSFTFDSGGETLVEELYYRNFGTHTMKYRILVPVLGIESYDATIDLTRNGLGETLFTVSRNVTFEDPAGIDDFVALAYIELANVQAHFADD